MTVQTNLAIKTYTGNGVTLPFAIPFRFLDNTHIAVTLTPPGGTAVPQILTTDYSVEGARDPNGGTVTMVVAPPVGYTLTIQRNMPFTQLVDYRANDPFPEESAEDIADERTMEAQQINEVLGRAIKLPPELSGYSGDLPAPQPLYGIRWNAAGTGIENYEITPFTSPSGANMVGFLQAGTGAATRTVQAKLRDRVSVTDFTGNDPTGVLTSDVAFAAAIASLPANGGEIDVPTGIWQLDVTPTIGSKSIQWNISAGATFTGTVGGTNVEGVSWPRADTNYTLVPFGVFSQVRTVDPLLTHAPASGLFEALQPTAYAGNSVALYAGARGAGAGNVWSLNTLVSADAGATGTFHGIELDVNTFSAAALVKGLGISGVGTVTGDVAIEIQHGIGWDRGIDILNSTIGVQIRSTCATALSIYNPSAGGVGSAISAKQLANGNQTINLERFTDAAPTGNFLRFRNAADSADLYRVGVDGAVVAAGVVTSAGFTTTGTVDTFNALLRFAAPAGAAGSVGLGNATGTTVGAAGGAAALPASPLLYWAGTFNGVAGKIPVYNA